MTSSTPTDNISIAIPSDLGFRVLFHRFQTISTLAGYRLNYLSPLELIGKCNQNKANETWLFPWLTSQSQGDSKLCSWTINNCPSYVKKALYSAAWQNRACLWWFAHARNKQENQTVSYAHALRLCHLFFAAAVGRLSCMTRSFYSCLVP